jgi:cytochrome o ubiquinol oxidase subunit 2
MGVRRFRQLASGLPLMALALAGCQPAVLQPEGAVGAAERTILIDSMAIMLAIVVPTIIAIFAFAWWFRADNPRARRSPGFVYSGKIELIVWSIPLLVIMLLGGVAWIGAHDLDPYRALDGKQKPLDVQVVSLDWKWLFIYPDQHVASVNDLVIPAGVPVHFWLTSASVMNAFFIPQLGGMIYTMNGMTTQLHLIAAHPGTYLGRSSHYSGDGFSGMKFAVHAVPPDQFAAWLASTQGHGPTLDPAGYLKLARQSQNVAPFTFGNVDQSVFRQIATQKLPPGPGPRTETPQDKVSPRSED